MRYGTIYITRTGKNPAKTGITVEDNELSVITNTYKFGRRTEQSVLAREPENENSSYAMVTTDYTYKQYEKNGETLAERRIDTISNTAKATGKADSTPYTFAYEKEKLIHVKIFCKILFEMHRTVFNFLCLLRFYPYVFCYGRRKYFISNYSCCNRSYRCFYKDIDFKASVK